MRRTSLEEGRGQLPAFPFLAINSLSRRNDSLAHYALSLKQIRRVEERALDRPVALVLGSERL